MKASVWMVTPALSDFELHSGVWALVVGLLWWNFVNLDPASGQLLSPITCTPASCSISTAFHPWPDREDCKVAKAFFPTSEHELVAAVAEAVRTGRKLRVISRGAHSTAKLVCPGGEDGYLISTSEYNRNIVVDREELTATVDAGVELTDLFRAVSQHGLAFPNSPTWAGLSIAGIVSTGAHGSSLWGKGGAVYEYVVGMSLVVPASESEGYAKIVTLGDDHEDLKAARISLGLLGVISTVTLRLEPQFKRSVTFVERNDKHLATQVMRNARRYEFGSAIWYPSLQRALFREDMRVPVSTPGEGAYREFGFGPVPVPSILQIRRTEEDLEFGRNASGKCALGADAIQQSLATGMGFTNNGTAFEGFPVIGFQNDLLAYGGCQEGPFLDGSGFTCLWDRRLQDPVRLHETGFILPFSHLRDFERDVKALRAKDPISLCGLCLKGGILMRYVKKSRDAYLGYPADGVSVQFVRFRSSDPRTPTLSGHAYDEMEQLLQLKYGARPHLGKNFPSAFIDAHERFADLPKFLEVAKRFDPKGVFSTELTDQILNVDGANSRVQQKGSLCGLEGLCICECDEHCNPAADSFCTPGLVFPEARVCRLRER